MNAFEAYEQIVALGGSRAHEAHLAAMRQSFEARTGAFRPEDRWFEARSRAFWDDAIAKQGFARHVAPELADAARVWVPAFERAHRGLFRALAVEGEHRVVLSDVWSGADFVVDSADDSSREALDAAAGLFDARLVARGSASDATAGAAVDVVVAMLPGALFHPEDATDAILAVVDVARERELSTDEALDALLRMERSLRSLSRVKTAYAYRADGLQRKT